jgi:hypothetical protein
MSTLQVRVDKMKSDAIEAAIAAANDASRQASVHGQLNSSRHLLEVNKAILSVAVAHFTDAAAYLRQMPAAIGRGHDTKLAGMMHAVRDRLISYIDKESAAARSVSDVKATATTRDNFISKINEEIEALLFDYTHNHLFKRSSVASVINSNTVNFNNSPVTSSVIHITQSQDASPRAKEMAEDVERLLSTSEVMAMPPEDREDVEAMARGVLTELGQPTPDRARLSGAVRRLTKFLGDAATSAAAKIGADLLIKAAGF